MKSAYAIFYMWKILLVSGFGNYNLSNNIIYMIYLTMFCTKSYCKVKSAFLFSTIRIMNILTFFCKINFVCRAFFNQIFNFIPRISVLGKKCVAYCSKITWNVAKIFIFAFRFNFWVTISIHIWKINFDWKICSSARQVTTLQVRGSPLDSKRFTEPFISLR